MDGNERGVGPGRGLFGGEQKPMAARQGGSARAEQKVVAILFRVHMIFNSFNNEDEERFGGITRIQFLCFLG